jgi:hypothetical protein
MLLDDERARQCPGRRINFGFAQICAATFSRPIMRASVRASFDLRATETGHRGRLELLYFGGIRIDRRPSRIWIGLARCVNLAHAFTAAGVSC